MRVRLVGLFTRWWKPKLPRSVGQFEALLFPLFGTVEWLQRHALVITELERMRGSRHDLLVLDFGGGDRALWRAMRLYGRSAHYRVLTADIDSSAQIVLDPEGTLPLGDNSVDVVVSSDVFEHIPDASRPRWAAELRRVARIGQVHTFPADGGKGAWMSTWADRELDAWHRQTFGTAERWTAEHLANRQPTVEEMESLFPGSEVRGFANVHQWLEVMREQLGQRSLAQRLGVALRMMRARPFAADRPPWKAALLVSEQSRDARE